MHGERQLSERPSTPAGRVDLVALPSYVARDIAALVLWRLDHG